MILDRHYLLKRIDEAFAGRGIPAQCVRSGAPDTDVYQDARAFAGMSWNDVDSGFLERHSSAMHGFSPEAYCYYLGAVLATSVREGRSDLLVVDSIVQVLDRSNLSNTWDESFSERWTLLSRKECEVISMWVVWLLEENDGYFSESELDRAISTLEILGNSASAIPIAKLDGN